MIAHTNHIEIQCNLKVVDYLDVTLNLNDSTHKPYRNTMQPESRRLLGCDFRLLGCDFELK